MPCDCSHLEPTARERELQEAAILLRYVLNCLGKEVPAWCENQAERIYADDERAVTELCAEVRAMSSRQRERIIYDAHDPLSRRLADWHEKHLKIDAEREAIEERDRVFREEGC